ncbi:MAG: hypothetical protein FJ271_15120 [Planctomycetes bacterium]|nr:hypothetical protein [Planctomycetota bacterium]
MDSRIQISYEPISSKGRLLLHVMFGQDDKEIYDGVILGNERDEVIRLTNEASQATGISLNEIEQQLTGVVLQARDWWARYQQLQPASEGFQANFLTSAALEKLDARHRWLIKHVLVRDQPVLLGGPKKSLKTSIMLDAAISLGSGMPFLNKFEIPERVRVAVLSGESGQITIRETARRIAKYKGVPLGACDVLWGFELPRLGVEADIQALASALREQQVAVVFVDPAYLCLLAGTPDLQANNMFQVGPLLMRIAKVCQVVGTTLVLVHHTTKPAGMLRMQAGEPLELEDLAYSGFQEFARQWLLINRRQKYEPGTGKHLLWLNLGGSAGHSGCWGIDVEEGKLNDNFSGRQWLVQVRSMNDAMRVILEAKERRQEATRTAKFVEATEKVITALSTVRDGETQSSICKLTGLQARVVGPVLANLLARSKVVRTQIKKKSGQGETPYDAWRLASATEIVAARMNEEATASASSSADGRIANLMGKGDDTDTDFLDESLETSSSA